MRFEDFLQSVLTKWNHPLECLPLPSKFQEFFYGDVEVRDFKENIPYHCSWYFAKITDVSARVQVRPVRMKLETSLMINESASSPVLETYGECENKIWRLCIQFVPIVLDIERIINHVDMQ